MTRKRMISVLLIMALILSNLSVVYGMELMPQGDVAATTEEAIDNKEDPSNEEESENNTSDDAINEQEPTDGGIENQDDSLRRLAAAAATYTYHVKCINSSGVVTTIQSFTDATAGTAVTNANNYMNNLYKNTGPYKGNKGLVVTDNASSPKDNNSTAIGKVINMVSGIVYFKSSSATASFGSTYITPGDALHFAGVSGTSNANTTVRISGVEAKVATSKLTLIPDSLVYPNTTSFYYRDYYTRNSSGDLLHYVYKVSSPNSSTPYKKGTGKSNSNGGFTVDKAPSWMKVGTRYYSYDGITFYSDPAMTTKTGSAYYSYYKYLPYRSMSAYTSTDLNRWIAYKTASVSPTSKTSKLKSQGRNLVNAQNRYGINAVSELAFACLESAYGKSNYALNRNNLFGINAVDSNPDKANSFSSVRLCINSHTYNYLSRGYGDAKTDSRYFGLTPGNKAVGVNVKYASDPWHGEKISGIAYSIDKYLGSKDYRKFTVGVTKNKSVSVYKNAGSTVLYNLSNKSSGSGPAGIPVVILGSSGNYYMIQSDLPISGNAASYAYTYYYSNSIAYVKKSDITVVNNGSRTYTTQISKNNDLRNITIKVGSKNYLSGFNPNVTSYTVKVPKNTKKIVVNGTRLMATSTVSGNGTKNINKKTKTYSIKIKSKSGSTKTYKVKVVPSGSSTFNFGVYNSKTKLSNKSKKGKKTTASRPMKLQTKIKTNSKKTTVKMVIYNKKKKVVAQKTQYIYKTKTVKFSWNGKYTKHNKLKKKAGKYATRSKSGTKYYVRFIASRKGTTTHKGKYHTFYLYK